MLFALRIKLRINCSQFCVVFIACHHMPQCKNNLPNLYCVINKLYFNLIPHNSLILLTVTPCTVYGLVLGVRVDTAQCTSMVYYVKLCVKPRYKPVWDVSWNRSNTFCSLFNKMKWYLPIYHSHLHLSRVVDNCFTYNNIKTKKYDHFAKAWRRLVNTSEMKRSI